MLNLALTLGTTTLLAQTSSPTDQPPPGRGPRIDPCIVVFDANEDGTLDAREIAAAPTVLQTLAKESDGTLAFADFLPAAPARPEVAPPADAPVRPRRVPPIFAALDLNGDGVLNAAEIAAAATSLKTLDKNSDGQLTRDEIRPAFGPRGPHRQRVQRPTPASD
ncbi:MAG: hypothetical protein HZA31_07780 [Opitutae bacterium]|nr:hypothetical protein [Opitutae bacterium]